MIKRFTALLLIICPLVSYGQMSANIKYLFGQSEFLDEANFSQNGMQASLEYGFRLKQKRLEFHPGLGYRFTWNTDSYDGYFRSIDIDLNISIYPFDFSGDCDCPTFSKDGELFKKGFFLEISPGIGFQTLTRFRTQPETPMRHSYKDENLVWKIGGSAGLDIGLTENMTITPMISLTWLSAEEWSGLNQDGSSGKLEDYSFLSPGIRFSYIPDPKRRRRF